MPPLRLPADRGHERLRALPRPRALWDSDDLDAVALVAGDRRVSARELLGHEPDGTGPGVVAAALAASRERGAAIQQAGIVELTGLDAGDTAVLSTGWPAATRGVLAGLLHARHTVHVDTADPAAALRGVANVVVAADASDLLLTHVAPYCRDHPGTGVVVLGRPAQGGALRAAFAEVAGHDPLTFLGVRDGAAVLDPAPGSDRAGLWGRDPDSPAVTAADGRTLTAGELRARAGRVAAALHERVGDGGVVAFRGQDDLALLTACVAALRAGLAFVPLSPAATDDTVAHLVGASGAAFVAGDDLPESDGTAPWTSGHLLGYTSGTTGRPKVVRHRVRSVPPELAAARDVVFAARLALRGPGAHLVAGRLYQLPVLHFATLALQAGQELVLLGGWNPARAAAALAARPFASTFMAPAMFAGLLALPERLRAGARTDELRSVVHATAACPVPLKRRMVDWLGPVLYDLYAPTEAPGTYATPEEWAAAPGTVGLPLPGVEVRVLDEDGGPVPPGEPGLVHLTDRGFRYDDASAPHRRAEGLVSVGDVGYLDEAGRLFLVGRRTDYISVGGDKFHPSEVERVLETLDGVAECAVAGEPSGPLGQVPVAFVRLAGGAGPDVVPALMRALRDRLPPHQVPRRIEVVDALPRDEIGKLRRRELLAAR